MIGLKDKDVSEKLQLRSTLTLEQAIQYVRQTELVKTQIQDQTSQFKSLDEVKRYGNQKHSSPPKHFSAKQTHNCRKPIPSYPQCDRCNRKHGQGARCPARGQRCKACVTGCSIFIALAYISSHYFFSHAFIYSITIHS